MPETIKDYLETVQQQIRWKRARPVLIQELERHLEDQQNDLIKAGRSEAEAERLAIEDMGDPVVVGAELDRVHRPKPQWGLLGLTIALALAGAVLRAAFRQSQTPAYSDTAVLNALASLALGTAAMLGMYFFDVSRLARHARAVYIASLAAGALTLYPAFRYHPSYSYTALFYPLVYALWLYSFRSKGWRGLALTILGGVPLAAYCAVIPSMSWLSTLLLSGLILTLYAAGRDWFGVGRLKGAGAVLAATFVALAYLLFQGYLNSFLLRIMIAIRPELEREQRGFMGWMLRIFWEDIPPLRHGTGEAGLSVYAGTRVFGGGVEMRPLDFSHDFLPASLAAAWGWLPLALLLAALAVLLLWLLVKGLRQSYLPGRLVVLAVVLTLGIQTLFSAALNFGFVLFSASLPLVVGNLMTILDMALIGLALSVFRGDSIAREAPANPLHPLRRLRIRFEYQ